jgi:bifunctional polynucleotide phosphatase/kinase
MEFTWNITHSHAVCKNHRNNLLNSKIASFDLDDTLIKTKSGKDFSVNEDDWQFFDKTVPEKLKKLSSDSYNLVVITNQLGLKKGKFTFEMFKNKIEKILRILGMDFTVFISTDDDQYRKPRTKIWDLIRGDLVSSFYCGDAGGLKKRKIDNVEIKKDFSDTDIKFAKNIGVKFIHRDEFIFNITYSDKDYDLKYVKLNFKNSSQFNFEPKKPEVVINIGLPASGKSTFTKNYILKHDYEYINQDSLKTLPKCIKKLELALKEGKSSVIDNTNINREQRKRFTDLAKKYNFKCRCILFDTPREICVHNSYFRNNLTEGKANVIPKIVYNIMNKKYEKPTKEEGFQEIIEIQFSPEFQNDKEKELYYKFYS